MARQLAPGSCVRQILQKEVWLWAGNKWDVLQERVVLGRQLAVPHNRMSIPRYLASFFPRYLAL
jgi:hypothetical protein